MFKNKHLLILLALIFSFLLTGCDLMNNNSNETTEMSNIFPYEITIDNLGSLEYDETTNRHICTVPAKINHFYIRDINCSGFDFTITDRGYEVKPRVELHIGDNEFQLIIKLSDNNEIDIFIIIRRLPLGEKPEKDVEHIEISDFNREYMVGEAYKPSRVEAIYTDGSKGFIDITEDMVFGFSTKRDGEIFVEIVIYDQSFHVNINIKKETECIDYFVIDPKDLSFYKNQKFHDLKGIIYFENGTSRDILITKDMVDYFDTSYPGNVDIKVKALGLKFDFTINVYEPKPDEIVVKSYDKDFYQYTYVKTDIVLDLIFNGEVFDTITVNENSLGMYDNTRLGEQEVELYYGKLTTTITINFLKAEISEISANINKYFINESFIDGEVYITYNSGMGKTINVTKDMVKSFDTSKLGSSKVIFSYDGNEYEYNINVYNARLEPAYYDHDYIYYLNEGHKYETYLKACYGDTNESKLIIIKDTDYEGFKTDIPGVHKMTYSFAGGSYEVTFTVYDHLKVMAIDFSEFQKVYYQNKGFESSYVTVTFIDDSKRRVLVTEDMIENMVFNEIGTCHWRLHILHTIREVEVTIHYEPTVTSYDISKLETSYKLNEAFKHGEISISYSDGTTITVSTEDCQIFYFETKRAGTFDCRIKYNSYSIVLTYTVSK